MNLFKQAENEGKVALYNFVDIVDLLSIDMVSFLSTSRHFSTLAFLVASVLGLLDSPLMEVLNYFSINIVKIVPLDHISAI